MGSQQRRVAAGLKVVDSTTLVDAVTGVEYTGTGAQILDRMTTAVTLGNNAAETTLVSYDDPGGSLDVDRLMRWTLQGTISDTVIDTATTLALRFKYGATTLITFNITTDDATATIGLTQPFRLVFELWAVGSQAQTGLLSGFVPTTTGGVIDSTTRVLQAGTAAIDSESPQTLTVTGDWNVAAVSATMTLKAATLELL